MRAALNSKDALGGGHPSVRKIAARYRWRCSHVVSLPIIGGLVILTLGPFLWFRDEEPSSRTDAYGQAQQEQKREALAQSYCKITPVTMEAEWVEYFAKASWEVEPCNPVSTLAEVHNPSSPVLVPIEAACQGGVLELMHLDPEKSKMTSYRITRPVTLPVDSVVVRCTKARRSFDGSISHKRMNNLIMHPIPDASLLDQITKQEKEYQEWRLQLPPEKQSSLSPKRPNLLFIMVDSMSQQQAARALPQTMKYLKSLGPKSARLKHNRFSGAKSSPQAVFNFTRFNVVSSGTQNNVPAYLAGYKYKDLPGAYPDVNPFEVDWILETAAKNGYATAFVDGEYIGSKSSIPRVRLKTYESQEQTDDVMFWARKLLLRMAHHSPSAIFDEVLREMEDPPVRSFGNASKRLCFGGSRIFESMTSYVQSFWKIYTGGPRFAYLAPMDGHDPSLLRLRTIDDLLQKFLHHINELDQEEGRETLTILCGDHGVWYGDYFEHAKLGRLEIKMPALYLVPPPGFLQHQPLIRAALESNQMKLTTPFDVHASLRHFLKIHNSLGNSRDPSTGISLFEPHPASRTCGQANVNYEHCACVEFKELGSELLSGRHVTSYGELVMHHIRQQVWKQGNGRAIACRELQLKRVVQAQQLQTEVMGDDKRGDSIIQLRVQSREGDGYGSETFEALITHRQQEGRVTAGSSLVLKSLRVGDHYDPGSDSFENVDLILDERTDRTDSEESLVYVAQRWEPIAQDVFVCLIWINPSNEVYLRSVHRVQAYWTSSWQRRPIAVSESRNGGAGLWTLQVYAVEFWDQETHNVWEENPEVLRLGELIRSREFYLGSFVGGSDVAGGTQIDAAPVPAAITQRFWEVQDVYRASPYAKHDSCRDPRVKPDFCVCTTSAR